MKFRHELTDTILFCQQMQTAEGRQRAISDLPSEMAFGIEHNNVPVVHVRNIVDRCASIPGGLRRLLDVLTFYEGSTRALKRVLQVGVLVDLYEIISAEVGDSEALLVLRQHLPTAAESNTVEEVWPHLLALWRRKEAPHPIITLMDELSDSLPLAQEEIRILRDWTLAQPALGLEASPRADSVHALAAPDSVDYGDLELRIRRSDRHILTYALHSPNGRFAYRHHAMGSIQLEQITDLRAKLERLIPRLNHFASRGFRQVDSDESLQAQREIENIGIDLYNLLFPAPLQEEYWTLLRHKRERFGTNEPAPSLVISSDEPWIPWELVRPTRGQHQDSDFLAAEFAIMRHLPGTDPPANLTISKGHIVLPGLDLTMAEKEKEILADLAQDRFMLLPPISTRSDFLDLCLRGSSQLIHVATHARFQTDDISLSPIQLEDGEIVVQDLNQLRGASLMAERPFVFLNACHSSRLGIDLIGPEGWAKRFMKDFGVTAFVGSQWEISDRLALEFSRTIYEQLGNGVSLGQALFLARQRIRAIQPANPTWLAYACYGNPELRITWGGAQLDEVS